MSINIFYHLYITKDKLFPSYQKPPNQCLFCFESHENGGNKLSFLFQRLLLWTRFLKLDGHSKVFSDIEFVCNIIVFLFLQLHINHFWLLLQKCLRLRLHLKRLLLAKFHIRFKIFLSSIMCHVYLLEISLISWQWKHVLFSSWIWMHYK